MTDQGAVPAGAQADEERRLRSPVRFLPGEESDPPPASGSGLCLSGGGYRAMLFHLGTIRRLDETGLLGGLDRISSVSGGSITAGVLAQAWSQLSPGEPGLSPEFDRLVTQPVRALADVGIDIEASWKGLLSFSKSINDEVAAAYRKHLFGDAQLSSLPAAPLFVINATNMGSGALARFTRDALTDWRVGEITNPPVDIATAVACSSAFPPFLSPHKLDTSGMDWHDQEGNDLNSPAFRDEMVLSDGGVYDNLGLETVWKRCRQVIVSDAGGQMAPDPDPASDWPRHMLRVLNVIDNQVRSLRKRQLIDGFIEEDHTGVYLGIRSDIASYPAPSTLPAPVEETLELAAIPTRLAPMDARHQEQLMNWGYAMCDAGIRAHVDSSLAPPTGFPYPAAGVGG